MRGGFINKFIFLSFLTLVLTSSSLLNQVKAAVPTEQYPANAIWMEPSSITVDDATAKLGDKFIVTIWINITENSFAWQVKLFYNSTYFNATRVGYTNEDKSDFFADYSPVSITPKIDNTEGYILHGETLLSTDERAAGFGSLMWIEFNLIKIPPRNQFTLNFSLPYGVDTFVLTPFFDTIPMENVVGTNIPVIPEFPHPSIMLLVVLSMFIATAIITRRLKIYG